MATTVKIGITENEKFDVTKTVTNETEYSVSIVYPCDILKPTIKLKGGHISKNYVTGLFGRKYWITDQHLDNGINYVTLMVDAWSSWTDNIYGSTQFVSRSEKHGNAYLPDGQYPLSNKQEIVMKNGNQITSSTFTRIIGVI